jgi:hypothetical protein
MSQDGNRSYVKDESNGCELQEDAVVEPPMAQPQSANCLCIRSMDFNFPTEENMFYRLD